MNPRSGLLVGICLAAISTSLFSIIRGCPRSKPLPVHDYHCEQGHGWSERMTPSPRCPKCDAPGIRDLAYRCATCRKAFVGIQMKRLKPGEMQYRVKGEESWSDAPAYALTCPHCHAHGEFEQGHFFGVDQGPTGSP